MSYFLQISTPTYYTGILLTCRSKKASCIFSNYKVLKISYFCTSIDYCFNSQVLDNYL